MSGAHAGDIGLIHEGFDPDLGRVEQFEDGAIRADLLAETGGQARHKTGEGCPQRGIVQIGLCPLQLDLCALHRRLGRGDLLLTGRGDAQLVLQLRLLQGQLRGGDCIIVARLGAFQLALGLRHGQFLLGNGHLVRIEQVVQCLLCLLYRHLGVRQVGRAGVEQIIQVVLGLQQRSLGTGDVGGARIEQILQGGLGLLHRDLRGRDVRRAGIQQLLKVGLGLKQRGLIAGEVGGAGIEQLLEGGLGLLHRDLRRCDVRRARVQQPIEIVLSGLDGELL